VYQKLGRKPVRKGAVPPKKVEGVSFRKGEEDLLEGKGMIREGLLNKPLVLGEVSFLRKRKTEFMEGGGKMAFPFDLEKAAGL